MPRTRAEPVQIKINGDSLDDLRHRLTTTRWPGQVSGTDWQRGPEAAFMRGLAQGWRAHDWRTVERSLNLLPQFRATVDGSSLHFVHVRSGASDPLPLLLTHSWPSTFYEFTKLLTLEALDTFHGPTRSGSCGH